MMKEIAWAFFPDPEFSEADRIALIRLVVAQKVGGAFIADGFQALGQKGKAIKEVRLNTFCEISSAMPSNLDYFLSGLDADVLDAFPAQRLVEEIPGLFSDVDLSEAWVAAGGRFYPSGMVALKWDDVWRRFSVFNLPFPPFRLASGFGVDDVDRSEAEALGFAIPSKFTANVSVEINWPDFRSRMLSEIHRFDGWLNGGPPPLPCGPSASPPPRSGSSPAPPQKSAF